MNFHLQRLLGLWPIVPLCLLGFMAAGDEFKIRGTVSSVLYDTEGNPREGELAPGLLARNECEFIWSRKGQAWRLDIKEPLSPFKDGVWKTIMPFSKRELVTIISCPFNPDDTRAGGNAIVTVITNQYLTADNIYGGHAVWLGHNLEEVLALFGPDGKCPPFLDYDPVIHAQQTQTHEIRQEPGVVTFWNLGRYFDRDAAGNISVESGQPKLLPYPLLGDIGFKEAEMRFSASLRDEHLHIPEWFELTYWVPFRDEANPGGVRLVNVSKLTVQNQSVVRVPVPESLFEPTWTNTYATVIDFRALVASNQPLTYVTKSSRISPDAAELEKRKQFNERMHSAARSSRKSPDKQSAAFPRFVILGVLCILPIGIWFLFRKRTDPTA